MYLLLIIDDDKELLAVLETLLTNQGFKVVVSAPVYDIFQLVDQYRPDLVILDYLMIPSNGGELCSSLKGNLTTKNLPVIIFSAYDRVFNALGNYGCNLFLPKTVDAAVLVREINRLLAFQNNGGIYV